MTREERENALHCLKVMVGEEVCEECELYGTTGTDHCEADCVRVAIEALKKEPKPKPMIEIDLYSVIKQKYIEREVLDKIRAEIYNAIEFERKWLCDAGHTSKDIDIALNAIKSKVKDVLEKGAESEDEE